MPKIGTMEILIILAILLLLFGAKRLPDTARGLGRSLRIFKSEVKAAQDDEGNSPPQQIQASTDEVTSTPPQTPAPHPTAGPTTPDNSASDR